MTVPDYDDFMKSFFVWHNLVNDFRAVAPSTVVKISGLMLIMLQGHQRFLLEQQTLDVRFQPLC